jgi:hypothetical protein
VIATLYYMAFLKHEDGIAILDGGQPLWVEELAPLIRSLTDANKLMRRTYVSNTRDRQTTHHAFQRLQHGLLRRTV